MRCCTTSDSTRGVKEGALPNEGEYPPLITPPVSANVTFEGKDD